MADQTRKPRPKKEEEQPEASESTSTEEKDEELDDLLDEIDEVLESNAEDFVRGFVQKGGQGILATPYVVQSDLPVLVTLVLVTVLYIGWRRKQRDLI